MLKIKAILVAGLLLVPLQSFAHVTWINGDPVPSYVKANV